jgi:hypothetical protein
LSNFLELQLLPLDEVASMLPDLYLIDVPFETLLETRFQAWCSSNIKT